MPEKTDRRTLYTRAVIRDAFLELIAKGGWRRLSVTLLCKKADIARATFYLHYANLDEVLDDVLRDAFQVGDDDIRRVLRQLRPAARAHDGGLPRLVERPALRAHATEPTGGVADRLGDPDDALVHASDATPASAL